MKLRKLLSCVLCSVVLLSVVFSNSLIASAVDIEIIPDIDEYISFKDYGQDDVKVTYNFLLSPYTDIYFKKNDDTIQYHKSTRDNPIKYNAFSAFTDNFKGVRFDTYLLGYGSKGYKAINCAAITSGSNINLNFSFKATFEDEGIWSYIRPALKIYWYDDVGNSVADTSVPSILNPSPSTTESDTYIFDKSVDVTVPEGAHSFVVAFFTDYMKPPDGMNCNVEVKMDHLKVSVLLSSMEAESKEYEEIKGKLEAIEEEEKKQSEEMEKQTEEQQKQTTWLGKLWDAITALPKAIIDGIKEAVYNLFVPTEGDILEVKNKYETLLESRFGLLWQSATIIDDFASSLKLDGKQEVLTLPELSVDLAGSTFTFGGFAVDVVPDRFTFLIESLRLIVNVLVTILCINSMKKRLESVIH